MFGRKSNETNVEHEPCCQMYGGEDTCGLADVTCGGLEEDRKMCPFWAIVKALNKGD